MTTVTKWALGVAVLAIALIIALLPHGGSAPTASGDLGADRAKAALQPCPAGGPGDVGQLAGVQVDCLGGGARVDLGKAVSGGPVLVNVWASWCVPCKTELPVLQRYAAGPGAVRVLGVQVASPAKDGLELLADLGVHLPSVYDGEGQEGPVRSALKVTRLPSSYLVGADGRVRLITAPPAFDTVDQVRAAVEGTP